jgi:SAM-dependent MidA family methyltransferase
MSADIAQFVYTLRPELLSTLRFIIIEPLESLRVRQQRYLDESFGGAVKFEWYESLDEVRVDEAFVVANELFDAFACEVVKSGEMLYIDEGRAVFGAMDERVRAHCEKYKMGVGEVAIGYEEFASSLARAVGKCEFVTFDYGQKYARNDVSLRVYAKQKTYPFFSLTEFAPDAKAPSLSELYKKSDLTYDVNFAHLSRAFAEAGWSEEEFCTQGSALVEFGLSDLLDTLRRNVPEEAYRSELGKAMQLIDPSFLGERFMMIRFRRSR